MPKPLRILIVQFGPIGDALMALSLFDDILILDAKASMLIITRRNAGLIGALASTYSQIQVRAIPEGIRSIPFFLSLLTKQWTLMVLGVALNYSSRLKLFFLALTLIPGNRTVGLDDRVTGEGWLPLQNFVPPDNSLRIIESFRRLLPLIDSFDEEALARIASRAPHVRLATHFPEDFPFEQGTYIVVHLFGMARYRSLPVKRWKSLLTLISTQHPELTFVFTGDSKDKEMMEDIASAVPHSYLCINQSILDVAGIIEHAALYIGVDTGITHLAGVLQQKSLIISHNGDLRWTLTYNPNARILVNSKRCTCGTSEECYEVEDGIQYRRCMYDITDQAVLSSVSLALSSPERQVPDFAGRIDEHVGMV